MRANNEQKAEYGEGKKWQSTNSIHQVKRKEATLFVNKAMQY